MFLKTVILVSLLIHFSTSVKLPSNFQKCNRKQPDLKECILKAAQDGVSKLTKAYEEVNIANANPLEIPEISVSGGSLGQKFTNCKFYGLKDTKLDKFEFDFDKHTLEASGVFPEFRIEGDYEIDGKILVLPVKGSGSSNAVLGNVKVGAILKYEEVKKRGKTYMNITSCQATALDPETAVFRFDNLFGGDKAIGDNINKVLNENWREVYDEFKKSYIEVIQEIIKSLLNGFFSKVSIEEALD